MKTKDILVGFIILVVAISAVILIKRNSANKIKPLVINTPSTESKIKNTFKNISFSDDENKIELKDVNGGESFGVVTKTEILANLPQLNDNQIYTVVLIKGEDLIKLGKMKEAKGGFILEFNSGSYVGYKVRVLNGNKVILEGVL